MKKVNPEREPQLFKPENTRWKSISNALGVLLLFIGISTSGISQTIQIGSGTAVNSYIPLYYLYNYNYSQTIYTQSELTAAGMDPTQGLITKVRYKATTSQSTANWQDWEIYMGNTTKVGFDSGTDWIGIANITPVFNGTIAANVVAGQWLEITLTTPFQWDGTSNIVVAVNETTSTYGNNPGWSAYTLAPSTGQKAIYKYEDAAPYSATTPPIGASRSNTVAQIQFDGNLQAGCSGTPVVAAITAPASVCLGLDVDLVGSLIASAGISYQWQESPNGTTWTDISGATNATHTIVGGITADTYYRLKVTCANGGTFDTSNEVLVDLTSAFLAPWTYDVETASESTNSQIEDCWSSTPNNTTSAYRWDIEGNGGGTPSSNTGPNVPNSGNTYFYTEASSGVTGAVAELITPQIDVSGLTTASLKFYFHMYGVDISELSVGVSTDMGATWTSALTITGAQQTASTDPWLVQWVDLSAYTGVLQLRFKAIRGVGFEGDMAIDDISVIEAPSCIPPSALTSALTSSTSAELGWTQSGSATVWNIQYGAPGFTIGSGTPENAVTNPYNLTGLTTGSTYEYYVQADCGSANLSTWTGPFEFSIDYCEVSTTSLFEYLTSITSNGAVSNISYTASSFPAGSYANETAQIFESYETQTFDILTNYSSGINGVNVWVDWNNDLNFDATELLASATGATQHTLSVTVPTGTPQGNYRMRVRGQWGSSANPPACGLVNYGSTVDFTLTITSPPSCLSPTALTVANLNYTTADLGWTDVSTNWEIEYGAQGFTIGSGASAFTSANPYAVSNLTPNTNNSFYVRAICAPGDTSTWAGPYNFYTGPCTPSPTSVDGIGITNVTMGTINNTTGAEPNNYGNYTAQSTSVPAGTTLPIDITLETGYTYNLFAWVDWNGDLDFDDANEGYYLGESTNANPTTFNASILIPAGAVLGNYSIRIGGADNALGSTLPSDPCYTGAYATFEEYTLTITAAPPCADPSALTASNFTTNTADLAWTENGTATTWNIEYGPAGFGQGTGTALAAVTSNPHTLTGLMPCMNYDYYVQADCGGGNLSAWVGPLAFTTFAAPATGTDTQVACDTYTWMDGNTYTSSNNTATFTIVGGGSSACGNDSIVTLDLTINTSATGTDTQVACDTYTWIDGNTYTSSNNTATHTIMGGAANGCDSIVTLDLTINTATMGTDTQAACETFTWIDGNTYTSSSNTVTFTIVGGNANGCDSIVTLDLTIDMPTNAGDDVMRTFCMNQPLGLDTLLSANADAGGTWVDPSGNAITGTMITLSGQPDVYIYTYVTAANGACPAATASIEITVDGGCDYLSITDEAMVDISVYPNPATSNLTILNPSNTSSLKVEMLDMNGRIVLVENKALNNATEATLAIDYLERGIYTLRIYNTEGQKTFKIVKQ
ncbi:T9SS type A sorting domain-containing protein [Brumimicrobium glaciale]|uniref:T9SS type A sorting domain-containing protein n=1 Tax=Brumimicrobium glaciale TaxID=200475 RepID=A0A4Q4KUG3_9FLAO|nr:GEVED domain-containing protein [Brumimicrobium glaciale]RYM35774.1 T9SS type A sorting domain-containing protein [Brumimicrobium glaciale]